MSRDVLAVFATPLVICRDFLSKENYLKLKEYYINPDNKEIWQDFDDPSQIHNIQTKSKKTLDNFPAIKDIFEQDFNYFIKNLIKPGKETNFKIGASWAHKAVKGSVGSFHIHANYFWSGVYYLQDSTTDIRFFKSIGHYDYCFEMNEINPFNRGSYNITPTKNCLILFPAYMPHQVQEHREEKNRYSIAINYTPLGTWGVHDSTISMSLND